MRAIIINAKERKVYEVETPGTLKDLQAAVGGFIELVRLDDEQDLYVNEEGLLHDPADFFTYEGGHQPFAGNGIICGHDDEGNTTAATISIEQVRARVRFMPVSEVEAFL